MEQPKGQPLTVTAEVIDAYALLSGDYNPLHVDEAYAAGTQFGRRIAHGPIPFNVVLRDLGAGRWPRGMQFESRYIAPVGIGDSVTWKWVEPAAGRFEITNSSGATVVTGRLVQPSAA